MNYLYKRNLIFIAILIFVPACKTSDRSNVSHRFANIPALYPAFMWTSLSGKHLEKFIERNGNEATALPQDSEVTMRLQRFLDIYEEQARESSPILLKNTPSPIAVVLDTDRVAATVFPASICVLQPIRKQNTAEFLGEIEPNEHILAATKVNCINHSLNQSDSFAFAILVNTSFAFSSPNSLTASFHFSDERTLS